MAMMVALVWSPEAMTAALPLDDYDPGARREVILELALGRHVLDDAMLAIREGDVLYVPVGYIARRLELGVRVEPESDRDTIEGWLGTEDETISFDGGTGEGRRAGEPFRLDTSMYLREAEDIYVAAEELDVILPVRSGTFDAREQRVTLEARGELPLLERLKRQARWDELRDGPDREPANPLEPLPYRLWTPPSWAVALEQRLYSRDEWPSRLEGEYRAAGDWLHHEGRLYATTRDDTLERLDVTMARDYTNPWLRRYAVGQITNRESSLLTRHQTGLGVKVTNTPPGQRGSGLANQVVEGNAPEGWSAELYRNGELIDYIESIEGSRYRFDGVPVDAGENRYDILLYGPRGQVRSEQRTFHAGAGILPPGEVYYDVSHMQPRRSLVGEYEQFVGDTDSGRSRGRLRAGLTRYLSGGLELHQSRDATAHPDRSYATELTGSLGLTWWRLRRVEADDGGLANSLELQRPLGSWNTRLQHADVEDLDSEELGTGLDSRSEFVLSGPVLDWFRWRSDYREEWYAEGGSDQRLRLSQTTRLAGMRLGHRYERNWGEFRSTRARGTLDVSRHGARDRFGFGLLYTVEPDSRLDSARASWNRFHGKRLRTRLELRAGLSERFRHAVRAGFGYTLRYLQTGLSATYEEDGEWSVMAGLEFGGIPDPHTGDWSFSGNGRRYIDDGTAAVQVVRREGEEVIPQEGVTVNGGSRRATTNESGVAMVNGLTPYERHDIELDLGGIENPFIRRLGRDVSMEARPGAVQPIRYELAHTGEIEGTVRRRADGERVPVPGVRIQALDSAGEVVAETSTAYDGLYILDRLLPGAYTVRLHPDDARYLGVDAEATAVETELEWGGEIVYEMDILL